MQHNYSKENKNVRIRPLEEKDIEMLRKWRNNKESTIYLKSIPHISKEMQIKWFKSYLDTTDEVFFGIEEIGTFNRLVGSLSLYDIRDEECVLGKILIGEKKARGCGIGFKAIQAAIEVALEQLGIVRIKLYVYKKNVAALCVYKKVGFDIVEKHGAINDIEYTMEYRKRECNGQ